MVDVPALALRSIIDNDANHTEDIGTIDLTEAFPKGPQIYLPGELLTQLVDLTTADGVVHVRLNRPEAANTINMPMAAALGEAVERIALDGSIKVVLLSAAGSRFCAGGDIRTMAEADRKGEYIHDLAATADAAVQRLESLHKPVVAAVHGAVAGAGLGIMLAADVIIAAETTKFVYAYPAIGLTADCGASRSLPRALGLQRALAFALSGKPMSADQAVAQGLVTELADDPLARAREVAARWATGAPEAMGTARQLLRESADFTRKEMGRREATSMGERLETPEAHHLVTTFLSH